MPRSELRGPAPNAGPGDVAPVLGHIIAEEQGVVDLARRAEHARAGGEYVKFVVRVHRQVRADRRRLDARGGNRRASVHLLGAAASIYGVDVRERGMDAGTWERTDVARRLTALGDDRATKRGVVCGRQGLGGAHVWSRSPRGMRREGCGGSHNRRHLRKLVSGGFLTCICRGPRLLDKRVTHFMTYLFLFQYRRLSGGMSE